MEARIAAVEARLAKGPAVPGRQAHEAPDLTDAKLLLAIRTFAELNEWSAQGRKEELEYFNARISAMEDRVTSMEKRLRPGAAV